MLKRYIFWVAVSFNIGAAIGALCNHHSIIGMFAGTAVGVAIAYLRGNAPSQADKERLTS